MRKGKFPCFTSEIIGNCAFPLTFHCKNYHEILIFCAVDNTIHKMKGLKLFSGHPKLVQKLSEGDITEKVKEFMTDPATMKKNKAKLGFKLSSAKMPIPDDTTDRFLGISSLTFYVTHIYLSYVRKR